MINPWPCCVSHGHTWTVRAREALLLARLSRSPHLIRYHGLCRDHPTYDLMIMEYAPHGTVLELVRDCKDDGHPLSLEHKRQMLDQIASAMEVLSLNHIVHRDLAARNVLVFEFDAQDAAKTLVKVTDFGLSLELTGDNASVYYKGGALPLLTHAP